MAVLLKGAPVAAALNEETAAIAAALTARGKTPTLAILRVGEKEADLAYERAAARRCAGVGVAVRFEILPETVSQAELMETVARLNGDAGVHGVLIFSPLPRQLDEEAVRRALAPEKDVDGVTDGSLGSVLSGSGGGFPPCTAQACLELLNFYGIDLAGKTACVIGRSLVVGKPAAALLTARDATVTLCHSKTRDLAAAARSGDILITAVGRAGAIGGDCFRPGQVVIDVGTNVGADGSLTGDCDHAAAEAAADCVSPVPGGVGTVTTAVLARHVVQAAEKAR